MGSIQIEWRSRSLPLIPSGVVASGASAMRLAQRLLIREDETLGQMKAVAAHALLIVLGDEELLPWADGAQYIGRDSQAPALLLPTTREPNIPISLFEKALLRHIGALLRPIAVFENPLGVASLAEATAVTSDAVKVWLENQ